MKFKSLALAAMYGVALAQDGSSGASQVTASFDVKVPSNSGNPFLDESNLPEGTLFIACGSILLGIFVAVAIWRLSEIYSARKASKLSQEKYQELSNNASRFNKVEADYDLSVPGTFNAAPQLFFSPTVSVMQNGSIGPMVSSVAQSNTYLPSGYYNSHNLHSGSSAMISPEPSVGVLNDHSSSPSLSASAASGSMPPSEVHLPVPKVQAGGGGARRKQRPPSEFMNDLLNRYRASHSLYMDEIIALELRMEALALAFLKHRGGSATIAAADEIVAKLASITAENRALAAGIQELEETGSRAEEALRIHAGPAAPTRAP